MGKIRVEPSKNAPLEQVLKALGDPIRLSVVTQILKEKTKEKACGTFGHGVTPATFTHHINILIEAGIIEVHKEGTRSFVSIREKELERKFPKLLDVLAGTKK